MKAHPFDAAAGPLRREHRSGKLPAHARAYSSHPSTSGRVEPAQPFEEIPPLPVPPLGNEWRGHRYLPRMNPAPLTSRLGPGPRRNFPATLAAGEVARQVREAIGTQSLEQLERIFTLADERREEDGSYLDPGPEPASGEPRPERGFDLMPLILGGEEWLRIETGLRQRVKCWNLFLRDIYSNQEVLKAGVVPYDIVYRDPNFQRGCSRLPGMVASYLHYSAFDLQQDTRGQWLVLHEHLNIAEGASYAAKKRAILSEIMPRLFDRQELLPVEDFAAQVTDHLQGLFPQAEGSARIVLLARGGGNDSHYHDHAALARQMGVPIVQGTDLVVIDSRLYLKTIAGVERVHVLLRRLPTALLDPVTFDPSSRFGVPGMLSCVRRGELAVANGLGSDLANNRALAAHLPTLIDYYLSEKPLLASPTIHPLDDLDRREEVAEKRDSYLIRHAWLSGPAHEWSPRQMSGAEWQGFWAKVEAAPSEFVAIKTPSLETYPCWTASGARQAAITLRVFALGEERISSCALAWSGPSSAMSSSAIQRSDRIKDVWILRDLTALPTPVYAQAEEDPRRLRLTSRVAESLFWMGRYAERAEMTARCLRIVQTLPWPLGEHPDARARRPLWLALAAVAGYVPEDFLDSKLARTRLLPYHLLVDRAQSGSVAACLHICRQNAENIREHLPSEVWSVLNRVYLALIEQAEKGGSEPPKLAGEDRALHQEVIAGLDELTGALQKHMLHNDAWHFWQLGVYAERSLMTILLLRQVITPEMASGSPGGPIPAANLDLLLQMAAGQYAYRSLFQARPVAARVVRLLLQDGEFPRSVLFCLVRMRGALAQTLTKEAASAARAPLQHCDRLIEEITNFDLELFFPRRDAARLAAGDPLTDRPTRFYLEWLAKIKERLLEFNVLISDHYLDHQSVFREPELFDLPR